MQSRKYYEAYWSQYDDVVTLNEFRKMLGGWERFRPDGCFKTKLLRASKFVASTTSQSSALSTMF